VPGVRMATPTPLHVLCAYHIYLSSAIYLSIGAPFTLQKTPPSDIGGSGGGGGLSGVRMATPTPLHVLCAYHFLVLSIYRCTPHHTKTPPPPV